MAGLARQVHELTTDETRNIAVDMSGLLDSGELLTGTPTVTGDDTMTISNVQRNSSALTINGSSVAIDEAVQFTLSGTTAGTYYVEVLCSTDASQIVEGNIRIKVVDTTY